MKWMLKKFHVALIVLALLVGSIVFGPSLRAGTTAVTTVTVAVAQCSDGIDNDSDTLIDYPADPGCSSAVDDSEVDSIPQCSDGVDNDADAKTDLDDPGCVNTSDDNESDDPPGGGGSIFPPGTSTTGGLPPIIIVVPPSPPEIPQEEIVKILRLCDFNSDNRCNIVDLSILLYYADKPFPLAARFDLNDDGVIDLVDISILLFYWA